MNAKQARISATKIVSSSVQFKKLMKCLDAYIKFAVNHGWFECVVDVTPLNVSNEMFEVARSQLKRKGFRFLRSVGSKDEDLLSITWDRA